MRKGEKSKESQKQKKTGGGGDELFATPWNLERPHSLAGMGITKHSFSLQLTTSRIGNLTGLIYNLLYVTTIHTTYHILAVQTPCISIASYVPWGKTESPKNKKRERKPNYKTVLFQQKILNLLSIHLLRRTVTVVQTVVP